MSADEEPATPDGTDEFEDSKETVEAVTPLEHPEGHMNAEQNTHGDPHHDKGKSSSKRNSKQSKNHDTELDGAEEVEETETTPVAAPQDTDGAALNEEMVSRRLRSQSKPEAPVLDDDDVDEEFVNLDESDKTSMAKRKSGLSVNGPTNNLDTIPKISPSPEPFPDAPKSVDTDPIARAPSPSIKSTEEENMPPPSPPRQRILRSPFSFFRRDTKSSDSGFKSPPLKSPPASATARRDTAASLQTLSSDFAPQKSSENSDGSAKNPHRNSLKDRFKLLRMQEEAGIKMVEVDGETLPEQVAPQEAERPTSSHSKDEGSSSPGSRPRAPSQTTKPTIRESLPPGTAAGTSTGPTPETQEPVDWDLWQAVVYEGPAAVNRSSADELRRAIENGIPSAIRGVVWQVLANSQSQELEDLYRDLSRRGEGARKKSVDLKSRPLSRKRGESTASRPTSALRDRSPAAQPNSGPKEKESVASSVSSNHSTTSTPAEPANEKSGENDSVTSPSTSHDASSSAADSTKVTAALAAEEKRRSKEDAAALSKLEKAIRRDLGARTSYSKFLMSAGLQSGLFGICKAYALYDEEVGYAQGMNFIVMPLLFNMPEEEAFCLFARLMNHYKLRDLFVPEMPGLHMHLYQFERLLEDFLPAVSCHLYRRGVSPQLYATQWFLTLFAYRFPLQLVLRIYDLILSEGLELAILKFGIVLMQKNADALLGMRDMSALTTFLKEKLFDVYIDKSPSASSVLESGFFGSAGGIDKEVYRADALVKDATAVHISQETLKSYANEWEEKHREAKAAQAELDNLRTTNATLSNQLRTYAETSERNEVEHAKIATTLVHVKVENHRLTDENESLRVQNSELQNIISTQPAEIEARLKEEMERIMQRNSQVQNENRHLEEQVQEMETELVNTKIGIAEREDEIETLRRKWSSIQGVMNAKS